MSDLNQDIDRELAFHLDQAIAAKIAQGVAPAEARRQALVEFGGKEQVCQQVREVHGSRLLERTRANLRSALRFIRRSPSLTITIVVTLALGIGANSAVFSAVDAIVLRPLPFPHGDELVRIHQYDQRNKNPESSIATQRIEDWNRLNRSFQVVSGYYTGDATYTAGTLPEKLTVAFVAPRFLALWGVRPALGRDFTPQEEKFGGPNAVLVSYRFWRRELDADAGKIGTVINLSGVAYTVVGVLPASLQYPQRDIDLWEMNATDAPYAQDRNSTWFTALGRVKPGVTMAQAQADLSTVQSALGKEYPKSDSALTVSVEPLKAQIIGGIQNSLWLVYGSVSLLLIIACTNIAALLMARTAEREHEIAIRSSLGASRTTIVTQLLTEVFVLALAGALLGSILAASATHLLGLLSQDLPRVEEITLNWRIVLYSLGCGVAATLACGLVPALRGTRRDLSASLSQAGRTQVSGRTSGQWLLVGVQVSLAVALLVVSGLLLRSLQALGRVDPGFSAEHVLTLRISAGWGETADMGKLQQRIDRDLDALRTVPGVEAAATTATIPGNSFHYPIGFKIAEHSAADPNQKVVADFRIVSVGYFSTLHIPLLEGEGCRASVPGESLMMVNRSFAQKYSSGSSVVGQRLQVDPPNPYISPGHVLGVVGDVHEEGIESPAIPTVYLCLSATNPNPYFLVRTHGDAAAMADTLRRKLRQIEPQRSAYGVVLLTDQLDDRQAENRLRTLVVSFFALSAIALVSIGLYGTISYLGRTRRREIGLRLALGALPRQIVQRFLVQGLRITLAGCAIGLVAGAALSRLLAGMLFEVTPLDPVTYAGVVGITLLVAVTASFFPSLRAVRDDPTQSLRQP